MTDNSRQELRNLQAKYVILQQERQHLLEKIATLETKVSNVMFQVHVQSSSIAIIVHNTIYRFNLLISYLNKQQRT